MPRTEEDYMREEGRQRIVSPQYGELPSGAMRERLEKAVGPILTLNGESAGHRLALTGEVILDAPIMGSEKMTYREMIEALRLREITLAQQGITGVRAIMGGVADYDAVNMFVPITDAIRTSDSDLVGQNATYGGGIRSIPVNGVGVELRPLIVSSRGTRLPARAYIPRKIYPASGADIGSLTTRAAQSGPLETVKKSPAIRRPLSVV